MTKSQGEKERTKWHHPRQYRSAAPKRQPLCLRNRIITLYKEEFLDYNIAHFVDTLANRSSWTAAHPCFEVLYHVCRKYGLPSALYLDRASHFTTTRHARFGQRDDQLTHFEIALKTLAIEPIFAHSPQARGRGEGINGSFQRRLVPELRHHPITTIEPATKYLNEVFIPKYARRFGVKPQSPKPAFRPVPKGIDLRTILCAKTTRRVTNDDTISYQGTTYQLLPPKQTPTLAGITVQIQHWFDNSIHAFYPHLGEIPIQPLSPKNSSQSEEHL